MRKDKKKEAPKVSDISKKISEWEEKLSIAVVDRNEQSQASAKRMISYWKNLKEQ